MVLFPDCKINLGLDVIRRREDGYHDIRTVMYPVRTLCDSVEIVPADGPGMLGIANRRELNRRQAEGHRVCSNGRGAKEEGERSEANLRSDSQGAIRNKLQQKQGRGDAPGVQFSSSGLALDCPPEKNICIRAYNLMRERYGIGGVRMHLHKAVPFGAGLGGGSADGSCVLRGLNDMFGLKLDTAALESLAAELGSDTAFFIRDTPALCTGRGEAVAPLEVPQLDGKWLMIVKPPVNIPTGEAYAGLTPAPAPPIEDILALDPHLWRGRLKNDFEATVFAKHPILAQIKEELYALGALYASMSGSGAALYGIFASQPEGGSFPAEFFIHTERLSAK